MIFALINNVAGLVYGICYESMKHSLNKIIKIGLLTTPNRSVGNIINYLNACSDMIIIVKADNIQKFFRQNTSINLDLIIITEQPEDGTVDAPIYDLHRQYPNARFLYLSSNENISHIIWAIESGVGAYVPSSSFKFFFEKHFFCFINQGKLFLPIILELKIALHYYPPTEGYYLDFGLTQQETQLIEYLYQGLSIHEITTQYNPKKSVKTINQMIIKIYQKIDLRNSISII